MRAPTSSAAGATLAIVAVLVLVLVLVGVIAANSRPDLPGQVWRRGFLGGEQIRLQDNGRYQRESWSWFSETTLESGAWSPLADIVSLVPGTPGAAPQLMRKVRIDDAWFLYEATASGERPAQDQLYERVE